MIFLSICIDTRALFLSNEYNFLTGKAPTMCSCPIYFGIHLCTHWWKHIQEVDLKVVYLFHSPHLRHFIGLQSIYTLIKLQQKCQIYISGSVQYQITYIFCNIIFFHKEFYRAQWRPFFYHKDMARTRTKQNYIPPCFYSLPHIRSTSCTKGLSFSHRTNTENRI